MTMAPRPGLSRATRRAVLGTLCVLSLAACTDGYPTEDVAQIDPLRMTSAQLLAALNALGAKPHLGKRWRYTLHANCEVEVSVRNGGTDRRRVGLEGAVVSTRSVDGVTEVLLVPKPGGNAQAVTVLATRKWTDTVEARLLFTHLEVRCGRPAEPAA
jgi:hypothetical protein